MGFEDWGLRFGVWGLGDESPVAVDCHLLVTAAAGATSVGVPRVVIAADADSF